MPNDAPTRNEIFKFVTLSLVYGIFAYLLLKLQLEGTAASPIWLPAGIAALAAARVKRPTLCAGVFLGALGANAFSLDLQHSAIAAGIAGGNTLEALLLSFRLKKTNFNKTKDLLILGVYASLACAISATNGQYWISQLTQQPINPSAWLTWWGGDLLGIALCLPLLTLLPRPAQTL